jgi:hypothetical protein
MTELIAKPIIEDQYWVVTDGEKKVGNVQANSAGYEVILNGSTLQFNNTNDIKKQTKIKFQVLKSNNTKVEFPYPEYPIPTRTYNNVFDVKRKLHLFTKSANSKCLHAAGWKSFSAPNTSLFNVIRIKAPLKLRVRPLAINNNDDSYQEFYR